jgi:hypothetical protein
MDSTRPPVPEAQDLASTDALDETPRARLREKALAGAKAVQETARAAAKRLIEHRPVLSAPKGTTALDYLDWVDQLIKDANKNGVLLTKRDRKCLALWHAAKRMEFTVKRLEDNAKAEAATRQMSLFGADGIPHVGKLAKSY